MDLVLTNAASNFTMLTDGLEWCGLMWCLYLLLDSHSDGTHSLQSIHWWTSDMMLNFSKSVLMKKQTHLHLRLSEHESFSTHFWVNYFLNSEISMNETKLKCIAITKTQTTIEEKSQNSKKNTVVQRIFSILITQKLICNIIHVLKVCVWY